MANLKKVWGHLHNVFLNEQVKVDTLYLEKDSACSIHFHNEKINRFYLIKGNVSIKTDLGTKELELGEVFDVYPGCTHQFLASEDSILIEVAFVENGTLVESDITRKVQGGKFIAGKFYTLEELKEHNWINNG